MQLLHAVRTLKSHYFSNFSSETLQFLKNLFAADTAAICWTVVCFLQICTGLMYLCTNFVSVFIQHGAVNWVIQAFTQRGAVNWVIQAFTFSAGEKHFVSKYQFCGTRLFGLRTTQLIHLQFVPCLLMLKYVCMFSLFIEVTLFCYILYTFF